MGTDNLRYYVRTKQLNSKLKEGLHVGQIEVDNDPSRFKLLRCGRKWRKTSYIVNRLIRSAITTGLVCPYVAPNKVQAKNIAWRDHVTRELLNLKKLGVPYKTNEVELTVTFPQSGGMLQLLGVENKESLRGISNWGDFGGDELDDWQEDIWPLIIRPNLMTNKAPAILAGTPKGMRYIYKIENDEKSAFKCYHYTSYDNPELDPLELADMVEEYKGFGEDYFQQEIMAEFRKPVGLVYKDWPLDNFKSAPYDVNLPLHLTFDWGVNDPTALVWIQPNGSETHVIDYYEANNADIDHFVSVIRGKPYKNIELYTGDPAGKARNLVTNTSPIEVLATKGIYVRVKDGVRLEDQIRIANGTMKSLYINSDNPNCIRFRDILLNYKYPEKGTNLINQSNEVPIHNEFSHGARSYEYWTVNVKDLNLNQKKSATYSQGNKITNYRGYRNDKR